MNTLLIEKLNRLADRITYDKDYLFRQEVARALKEAAYELQKLNKEKHA